MFCELERSHVNTEGAAILVAEFLVWWEHAGRFYYDRNRAQHDEGLRLFAVECVTVLGGWRKARRTLRSAGDVPDSRAAHTVPPAEWLERYKRRLIAVAGITERHAEQAARAEAFEVLSDGFVDDPEGAADSEMSYWSD